VRNTTSTQVARVQRSEPGDRGVAAPASPERSGGDRDEQERDDDLSRQRHELGDGDASGWKRRVVGGE
jgi:hypothetical protein